MCADFLILAGQNVIKCLIAGLALFIVAPTSLRAETLELWSRPGGYTHQHIAEANRWLAKKTHLVIRDWQVSAAAIQVVYFKRRGGNICYMKSSFNADPALFFHASQSRGERRNDLAHYIGTRNAAKIGRLREYSYKRFHPASFGIKLCNGSVKATRFVSPKPSLMRW